MATKLQHITEVYESTVTELSGNRESWMRFLQTACRNYKCPFDEQVLIFAQRPDATAVLEIERWNKFGRLVNKGAKGIAVFDKEYDAGSRLKHYFDVSDTHVLYNARPLPIWSMKEEYSNEVIESLENTFGELAEKNHLARAILSAAHNAVEDQITDYAADLMDCRENSFLEEFDALNVEVVFKRLVKNSMAYMLMTRCGINADLYFDSLDFEDIRDFNTRNTLNALGTATGDLAETALREIAVTVTALDKQQVRKQNKNVISERSMNHGTDLPYGGRLSSAEFGSTERTGGVSGQILDAAQNIPDESPQSVVHESLDLRQTEQAFERNRADSTGAAGDSDPTNGTNRGRDGTAQSDRSNEMAGHDEQYPPVGRGNHLERTDLQLNTEEPESAGGDELPALFHEETNAKPAKVAMKPLPSVASQQVSLFDLAGESSLAGEQFPFFKAFDISQQVIDEVLCSGSNEKDSTLRICAAYKKEQPADKNIALLKDCYRTGGKGFYIGTTKISVWFDENGIRIAEGATVHHHHAVTLPWHTVEKRIRELLELGRYMPQSDLDRVDEHERKELADHLWYLCQNLSDEARELPLIPTIQQFYRHDGFPASTKKLAASLVQPEQLTVLSEELGVLSAMYDQEHDLLRFHQYSPDRLLEQLNGLRQNVKEFKAEPSFDVDSRLFITNDEIDALLTGGSGISEGKFRIYTYFRGEHTPKEKVDFLKQEYGDGGHGYTGFNEWHDSKGITYSRGFMATPYDKVLLPWSKVAKRIEGLIRDNRYMTEKELAHIPVYEQEHLAREICRFNEEETYPDDQPEDGLDTEDIQTPNKEETVVDSLPADELVMPPTQQKHRDKGNFTALYPELPLSDRHHFQITDNELGYGTPSEKYANNIAAIRLLKGLESETRLATPDEQIILSRYVGWGGLSSYFEPTHARYAELKHLLDEEEYTAARESTLTAFYTPPVVIQSMYQALANMGFHTGNVLEPSCGTGNFMGLLPDNMQNANLYGVELDSISGRIAQQLYQTSRIAVQGFEKTNLPNSFFDVAIGNVPFGQFKVSDKRYDKHKFLIHDYFFAKALDKVRPGGILAFITSKGTMDKENPTVRKYIAQRADLLGAIRLPNTTFKANAGTEVTSDILFLQKRDRMVDIAPDWVYLDTDENGIKMNRYFIDHPDMILGDMVMESTQFGMDSTCKPAEGQDLALLLADAIINIHAEITEYEADEPGTEEDQSIHADPSVRNFSYAMLDGKIYYRENSRMNPVEVSATAESRIKGMIGIRDCVRKLIEYQIEEYPDTAIAEQQETLNRLYDTFTKKYGLLNSRANNMVFAADSSYCLLCSLEILDENGDLERKADMFTKRTIKQHTVVSSVDTASEALAVSISEKACVDMDYMSALTGKSADELETELEGVIFRNIVCATEPDLIPKAFFDLKRFPLVPADEYLSGNVREKLQMIKALEQVMPKEQLHLLHASRTALEAVQPKDLDASEISVRLGATWISPDIVRDFMFQLLTPTWYKKNNIKVHYSKVTSEWNIEGKNIDKGNVKAEKAYGTNRINAYRIIEETLNLRDVRIFDYVEDAEGNKKQVLNKRETAIAQAKQESIKQEFAQWIWNDVDRREKLEQLYNEKFNSLRPREYDGSHIAFHGMNPEITLRPHQVNAIAHILYGGNTLLAHVVGSGKTFEMVAAAQESKRLGLCQKSLFVVPNHLTEQWASEYLMLYPSANILVATKKDFETKNRKKFCGRIATGEYDAVIIGHSQFEKIPMSAERQQILLQQQIEEITDGIQDLKAHDGERFSIKQLEKTKKAVQVKLDKLNDQSRKDDVVTFEELGVDRIFVDEAHYYKNAFFYTKMRNVGGIAQTEAQKSSDLFMKCRYLDEITGGKGVVFATGTPISNSMTELYTMQRYLQYGALQQHGFTHFDSWASTFGETVTAIELAPEGTGYRAKTRFSRFYNLPELMCLFKEVADIQTADILNLPVPKVNYHNVSVKPSDMQVEMITELSDRAERVRNKMVDSSIDNMLLITNDGRKLALDQRLANSMLPDFEGSKINACAQNVYRIWEENKSTKATQLVFCDISTPKNDGSFSVYNDIRDKLIARGVPKEEVQFIHDAESEAKKKELFLKVRKGDVRVLLGSTAKCGAGTNIQDRLIALHDIDVPWRPSDLSQRLGRIERQGNKNDEVHVFRYVTEQSFDAYIYQLIEGKQKFISQIMTSKSPVRSAEDIDETALSYAEIKALATGNPYIKLKMDLDIAVSKLRLLKQSHLSQQYALEDQLVKIYPKEVKRLEERISRLKADRQHLKANTHLNEDKFSPMIIGGETYTEKADAGNALIQSCRELTSTEQSEIGEYRGFHLYLEFDTFNRQYVLTLRNQLSHTVPLGTDVHGNITRIENVLTAFGDKISGCEEQLADTLQQMENARIEIKRPFPGEEEFRAKSARLDELNILLNMDEKGDTQPSNESPDVSPGNEVSQWDKELEDEEVELDSDEYECDM